MAGHLSHPLESDHSSTAGRVGAYVRPRAPMAVDDRTFRIGALAARIALRLGYRYPEGLEASARLAVAIGEMVQELSPR